MSNKKLSHCFLFALLNAIGITGVISGLSFVDLNNLWAFKYHLFLIIQLNLIILPPMVVINHFFCQKSARIVIVLFVALLTILFYTDALVYSQYRFHLSINVLRLFFSGGVNFDISVMLRFALYFIGLIVLQLILLWGLLLMESSVAKKITLVLLLLIGTALITSFIFNNKGNNDALRKSFPLLWIPVHRTGNDSSAFDFQQLRQQINNSTANYPRHPINYATAQPLNLLFVVIDAWRADDMNMITTPNVAAFADNSRVYKNHWSGGNGTPPGMFSLFYGLPEIYSSLFVKEGVRPLLLQRLAELNYQFLVYGSAALTSPVFRNGLFLGIDHLRRYTPGDTPWLRDVQITKDFINHLDDRKPFFGLLFYDAAHGYSLPENSTPHFQPSWTALDVLKLTPNASSVEVHNLYRSALYNIDGLIGNVLTHLKNRKLLDNTIVIITADHGQEFNDNKKNYWGHGSNFSRTQLQVPLVIHWPGKDKQQVLAKTLHYDISATLLKEFLHAQGKTDNYSSGHSLFEPIPNSEWMVATAYGECIAFISRDIIKVFYLDGTTETLNPHLDPISSGKTPPSLGALMASLTDYVKPSIDKAAVN